MDLLEYAHNFCFHQVSSNEEDSNSTEFSQCSCDKNTSVFDQEQLTKNLENTFISTFPYIKKQISPEFRKFLINLKNSDFAGLLKSCSIIKTLKTGKFFTLKSEQAHFLDPFTFTLHSTDLTGTFINLSDKSSIETILKSLIQTVPSTKLDKFLLKPLEFKSKPLAVLVYMGQFLLSTNDVYKINPRCVICSSKIIFMNKTGVLLSCGHIICFFCYVESVTVFCPLDQTQISADLISYAELDLDLLVGRCHGYHSLIHCEQVFKLKCGHLSCSKCIFAECCFECFKGINSFEIKTAEKLQKVLNSQQLLCDTHETKAQGLCIEKFSLFCEKCEKTEGLLLSCVNGFGIIDDLFNSAFAELIQNPRSKKIDFSAEFLKKCIYFKVLSLWSKYEVVRTLMNVVMNLNPPRKMQQVIECYSKLSQPCASSKKHLKLSEGLRFSAKFYGQFSIHSVVIGGKYVVSELTPKPLPVLFAPFMLEVVGDGNFYKQEVFEPCSGVAVTIHLMESVLVRPHQVYSFVFHLPVGFYAQGVPFFRLKTPQFSLLSEKGSKISHSNILGFILTSL